ncbi:hypothetical protein Nepgr_033237 [Nepenthes gracilis]|uniref:Uncharacterized protein n=1 Tax=Nepenthes gracilis TaxID=150966 RepID=A0AAD3Y8I8_NEPGR|nr:hypothetical protein Nepgr_033237 [Nepenthes gracilis]
MATFQRNETRIAAPVSHILRLLSTRRRRSFSLEGDGKPKGHSNPSLFVEREGEGIDVSDSSFAFEPDGPPLEGDGKGFEIVKGLISRIQSLSVQWFYKCFYATD